MSLIDEALKRAQAAHHGEPRPGGGARPWTPVPLPDRRQASRRRAWSAGVTVAVVFALAAGAWLFFRQAPGRPSAAASPATAPRVPAPLEDVLVGPPPRGVSAAQPTHASAAEARPAKATEALPAAPGPAPAPAAASPNRPAPVLANGHTYMGSVALPGGNRLELGGIVYSEANATALLNGKIVGAGAYVEGFTIVRIEPSRVELEANGLTIFLALK